jgi:polyisoprenoid-binding protein YceI
MTRPQRLAIALLGFALPLVASAQAAHYALDPVHTRIAFWIDHAGFSNAIGTVSGSTGSLQFDPNDWSTARVEATIPLRNLDLGDAKWDKAAQGLIDVDKFPEARFVSTRIVPVNEHVANVFGNLTLHGITREVELIVNFNQVKRLSLPPFHRIAGFNAIATIHRSDFGIDAWKTLIGDEIEMRIEVEALFAGAGDENPDSDSKPDPPPATDNTTPGTHP